MLCSLDGRDVKHVPRPAITVPADTGGFQL
jgi:hypothetical protein